MIVDIKYAFPVVYVPYRARKEKRAVVVANVMADVAEVSPAEAPVVCRVPGAGTRYDDKSAPRTVDYRYWDGRFWSPDEHDDYEEKAVVHLDAATFAEDAKTSGKHLYDGSIDWQKQKGVTLDSLAPCRFVSDVQADADKVELDLKRQAADYLVLEGRLWRSTPEPVLKLNRWDTNFGREVYWDIEVISASEVKPETSSSLYFRADQLKEATAALKRKRRSSRNPKDVDDDERKRSQAIKVLRPEFLAFRYDMRPRVESVAREVVERMKHDLEEAEVQYLVDYAAVRDALKADPIDHGALVGLVDTRIIPHFSEKSHGHFEDKLAELKTEWDRWAEIGPPVEDEDIAAIGLAPGRAA